MRSQTKIILIIDDDVINLKEITAELEAYGLEIIIARNGETGLERAAYAQPDLILLDVQLPGIDGFETCRRLKANKTTCDIPVIFMTALLEIANGVCGFDAGAVDYLTKPIQVAEMLARVKTHLTFRELQLEMEERTAELNVFVNTIAHDLRNPLSQIILGQEILQEKLASILDDEVQELITNNVSDGQYIVQSIDELLHLVSVRQSNVKSGPVDKGVVMSKL